jgi:hypothetical protein
MTSVPREVKGKWYPVPCPEFLSIGQSFPSYEACLAACETSDACDEVMAQLELTTAEEWGEAVEAAREEGDEMGYDRGFDNHGLDGCDDKECACFERGTEYAREKSA